MSEIKNCSYCGALMSTDGHGEVAIGGDGVFGGMIAMTCPAVPRDRMIAMNPPLMRPRSEPQPLPIVYDPQCPIDHEIEAGGVLLVGDAKRATHLPVNLEISADGRTMRVVTEQLNAKPVYEKGWPKGPLTSLPSPPMKITGGAVWTGAKAEEILRGGKMLLGPLTSFEFPNIPGVPKPTYALDTIEGELHYRDAYGRSTQITSKAIRSTFEVDAVTLTDDLLRHKGAVQKAKGILKHGPYGSGESGPCDADCAKCDMVIRTYVAIQRENTAARPQTDDERASSSAQWSAQLRVKVAEQKERDAEAARYTPWWSPEEQSGGDL